LKVLEIRQKIGLIPTEPPPLPPSTDPADYALNPAQFEAILSLLNVTVEQIDSAVDQLQFSDEQKAFAKARAHKATSYHRDNELFGLLGPILGISGTAIYAAWMTAKDFK
jgi:hypothetical protein